MTRGTRLLTAMALLLPVCDVGGAGPSGKVPPVWLQTFAPPTKLKAIMTVGANTFTVTSTQLGLLRAGTSPQLYDTATTCKVKTEVRAADRGFDLVYDISNETSVPLNLPALVLPGLPMAAATEVLNSAFGITWIGTIANPGGSITSPNLAYPGGQYCPVMVLRDNHMAVGLSLHYPLMEYRHGIELFAARWPGDPNWTAYVFLQGQLAPGEKRRYTVAARYSLPAEWIHNLQPYRDYFWGLYGHKPSYVQDLRPVYAAHVASSAFFSPTNPRGFIQPARPDLNGWKTLVDTLRADIVAKGYKRLMLWSPSGLYQANYPNNYPPQFMSEWTPVMMNSKAEFKRIQSAGVQVSFWWGHSTMVADMWDDNVLDEFDPANPAQVLTMMNEWKLLVQSGADGCGLDGFEQLNLWAGLPWLEKMRGIKPNVYLVAENACADVLHMRVPFWVNGYDLPTPHVVADYLVPGREIWVNLVGAEENLNRAKEIISWGLTVCWSAPGILAAPLDAAVKTALHESTTKAGPAAQRLGAPPKGPTAWNRRPR